MAAVRSHAPPLITLTATSAVDEKNYPDKCHIIVLMLKIVCGRCEEHEYKFFTQTQCDFIWSTRRPHRKPECLDLI